MKPQFSIIIPAHNEEKYIVKTLDSVLSQSFSGYEVIVVTNGCTDKTAQVVKKFGEKVKLYNLPVASVSRARNYGASQAAGDVLLFLDADTLLSSDTLGHVAKNFTEKHAVATMKLSPDVKTAKYSMITGIRNMLFRTRMFKGFAAGTLICWKKHFDGVNGFNPELSIGELSHLRKRFEKQGKYSCFNSKVVVSMRRYSQISLTKASLFWLRQWPKILMGKDASEEYKRVR